MSTPETPDFSALPPSEQPPTTPSEQLAHSPRRGGRSLAVAGLATALVVGTVGTAALVSGRGGGSDDVRLTSAQTAAFGEQSGAGQSAGHLADRITTDRRRPRGCRAAATGAARAASA